MQSSSNPIPHLTLVRQQDVESVLAQAVAGRGIEVEHGAELVAVKQRPGGVPATLRSRCGTETIGCNFVAACDGPENTVRRAAGWHRASYRQEVVLADVELEADFGMGVARGVVGRPGVLRQAIDSGARVRSWASKARSMDARMACWAGSCCATPRRWPASTPTSAPVKCGMT
jgi:2-polyprenyl-6-methoxyphenol hydroxylase-like FAD-dependent oxidoreductase